MVATEAADVAEADASAAPPGDAESVVLAAAPAVADDAVSLAAPLSAEPTLLALAQPHSSATATRQAHATARRTRMGQADAKILPGLLGRSGQAAADVIGVLRALRRSAASNPATGKLLGQVIR